jgi:hypothetical protein
MVRKRGFEHALHAKSPGNLKKFGGANRPKHMKSRMQVQNRYTDLLETWVLAMTVGRVPRRCSAASSAGRLVRRPPDGSSGTLRICRRRWHRRRMKPSESTGDSTVAGSGRPPEPELPDRVRAAVRLRHYSRRTYEAYVTWIRLFIVFHGRTSISARDHRRRPGPPTIRSRGKGDSLARTRVVGNLAHCSFCRLA